MTPQSLIDKLDSINTFTKEMNPVQKRLTLFIGGIADGQWIEIPEHTPYWDIPIPLPSVLSYRKPEYPTYPISIVRLHA